MDKSKPRVYFIGIGSEFIRFEQLNPGIIWTRIYGEYKDHLLGMQNATIIVGDSGRRLLYEDTKFGDYVNRAHKDNTIIYL